MSSREVVDILDRVAETAPRLSSPRRRVHPLAKSGVKKALRVSCDVVALAVAHVVAAAIVTRWLNIPPQTVYVVNYRLFFIPLFAAGLYLLDGNDSSDLRRPERELELVFKQISLLFLALGAANSLVFKGESFSRNLIVVWYCLSLIGVLAARFGLRAVYSRLWRRGIAQTRALLIGLPDRLLRYRELLAVQRHHAYEILGIVTVTSQGAVSTPEFSEFPVLGTSAHWERVLEETGAEIVVLDPPAPDNTGDFVLHVIDRCRELRVSVEVFSDVLTRQDSACEFNYFTGSLRLCPKPRWSLMLQRLTKAVLDIIAGLVGSMCTLAITPLVALLLKLEDGGPVFYPREFIGCDGKVHYYLKFRTMVRDADAILHQNPELKARFWGNYKLHDDPRVLKVGRFLRKYSIDEFPQFFSLFRGDLTLVGPRVIARDEAARYGDLLPKRLTVRPGITGYWQTTGRQTTSYDERVQMDMFYIDHWSIWLDLVIIGRTFLKLFWPEGAY